MPDAPHDRDILRALAARIAEVAALPVHREKADLWRRLNRLERVKPPVWINELPWDELLPESALQCRDPFCREHERAMRQILYQWDHLPGDMTVDARLFAPLVIHDTGFGLEAAAVIPEHYFGAKDYRPIIRDEADVERIVTPQVTVDREASERDRQRLETLVGDIIPVESRGITSTWFAPWDILITWWGVTEAFTDMVDRPELVHRGVSRMVDALVGRLEQYEALGALSLNNGYHRVGSGGLGHTDLLPQGDFDGHVRPIDMWGTATAQIFVGVSPEMHWEFALQYELRYLERFGLNCYGCCEPLHHKVTMLRRIPRLRRISMSRWVDVDRGAAEIGGDCIFSYKPNPAVLAAEAWNPEAARAELRDVLDRTRGCPVEVIMKDVSTVRGEPRRIWEWAQLAREVTEEYA